MSSSLPYGGQQFVDSSNPRSILLFRGNTLVDDFGEGVLSESQYGSALEQANASMIAGDRLVCKGAGVASVAELEFNVDSCVFEFNGLKLAPKNANYNFLVKFLGDNCTVNGLVVDGENLETTGSSSYPAAMIVEGDGILLEDCECSRQQKKSGTTGAVAEASGEGLLIYGDNVTLSNFYAEGNDYNAFVGYGDNLQVNGAKLINNRRAFTIRGSGDKDVVSINNLNCVVTERGEGPEYNSAECNFNTTGTIRTAYLTNSTFLVRHEGVVVGGRHNGAKVQNVDSFICEKVVMEPGPNASTDANAFSVSLALENGSEPRKVYLKDCHFARGGCAMGAGPQESFIAEGCSFGALPSKASSMFFDISCPLVKFTDCDFYMAGEIQRVFTMEDDTGASQNLDRMHVENCRFISKSTQQLGEPSYQYVFWQEQWFNNLLKNISTRITSYGNKLIEDGTVNLTMAKPFGSDASTKPFAELMFNTDSNGVMLFDENNPDHPAPGSGPDYFSTLPAHVEGAVIRNINWTPDGTQQVPEKAWIAHGGNWKEYDL